MNTNVTLVGNQSNQAYLLVQRAEVIKELARIDASLAVLRAEERSMMRRGPQGSEK